jgi:hypothetical protein
VAITFSQNISLKEKALEKFQAEHYDEATNLLEQCDGKMQKNKED